MAIDPLTAFTIETWTYLAISLVIVIVRFGVRWHWLGFRGLNPDDHLMVLAALLFTAETATAHFVGAYWQGMANNGLTDEERAALDPDGQEYYMRVHGSQTQLFGWLVYTVLLWTLKLCWLFFFKRLGDGVNRMTLKINIGFVLVVTTFLGTFFTILCSCWPIYKKWQINPDPGNICYPAISHVQAWTLIITNLSTDFYIIMIPLPMVWNARISKGKKAGLIVMFCGGLITAVFGGLRCGYVLKGGPMAPQQAGEWSVRESFVAMVVTNFPILVPIMQRGLRRFREATTLGDSNGTGGTPGQSKGSFVLATISKRGKKKNFKHPLSLPGETFYERYGSEEDIVESGKAGKDGNMTTITESSTKTQETSPGAPQQQARPENGIVVTDEWRVQSRSPTAGTLEKEKKRIVTGGY